jgi:hypothetical protein
VGNGGGAVLEVLLFMFMMQGAAAEGDSNLNEYKITAVSLMMPFSDHKVGKRSIMAVRRLGDIQYFSGTRVTKGTAKSPTLELIRSVGHYSLSGFPLLT